jgi:phage terminase large subunit GpA-like protein
MGFATRYKLGSCLFATSTKGIGKIRSSSAIDPLIDNSGLAEFLNPISSRMTHKTADTTYYKEFDGGIKWLITSYGSIGDMKSNTFQYIFCDEWDEAGVELKDQGDIAGILEGRTMGVRFYKMIYISTPSRMETSRIYRAFIEGDQRRFFVPCPHCGEPQILELKTRDKNYGLTFNRTKDDETGAKILDTGSVRYICKSCGHEWYESQKHDMLVKAATTDGMGWRETWRGSGYSPKSPLHKSYSAQGLISPFLSWTRIAQEFINTNFGEDIMSFKNFWINYLGLPWARVESAKSWEELKARADSYTMGEVPAGGLRIYGGVDVQGDRLEMMVVAVGRGMEKWVIDYQIFYGNPREENDKCWVALEEYAYKTRYKIRDIPVEISLVAIDCGYKPGEYRAKDWDSKAHTVFSFVGLRQDKFIAVRGAGEMNASFDIIKAASISGGNVGALLTKRYDINTHIIKEMIMRVIDLESGPQAIHFPRYRMDAGVQHDIGDEIFRGFLSERYQEVSPGKMGWKKFYRRNEPFDTFIYAVAAMYLENIHTYSREFWDTYETALTAP